MSPVFGIGGLCKLEAVLRANAAAHSGPGRHTESAYAPMR